MRARVVILIVAILVVAGFTALNWAEFTRITPLNFGLVNEPASLPLILLTALGLTLLAYLISSATHERRHLVEYREHGKALQAQRDLADKAEASRFTELRQHIDTQLRENRQREGLAAAEFEKTVAANYRELRAQLEQINRTLAGRAGGAEGGRNEAHADFGSPDQRVIRDERNGLQGDGRREPDLDNVRPGTRTTIL